jgi:hypothetical protein
MSDTVQHCRGSWWSTYGCVEDHVIITQLSDSFGGFLNMCSDSDMDCFIFALTTGKSSKFLAALSYFRL